MLQENFITEFLDLENMEVTNCESTRDSIFLHIRMKRRTQCCPRCQSLTDKVHDYRLQEVRDLPVLGKNLYWKYTKRRYVCSVCEKRFYEPCCFLPKYHQITNRVAFYALSELEKKQSRKDIAQRLNVSQTTMTRYLSLVNFSKPTELPTVVSIDEFRGNANGRRFQGIITDPVNRKILDITPTNFENDLYEYFRTFPNRDKVKYFVSDMKKEYVHMAKNLFPNATIVIDRFHVLRYANYALENVRKRVQKKLSDDERRYFKRSRTLLLKHKEKLKPESMHRVAQMLEINKDLANAYLLKEKMYEFMASKSYDEARKKIDEFMLFAAVIDLPEFKACTTMLTNWMPYILNAFKCPYSNGFTEGCNNTIKVIKRVAYGIRNFDNFRARILLVANRAR